MNRALAALLAAAALLSWAAVAERGFTTQVTAGLIARYTARFGATAPERLSGWTAFAKAQKSPVFQPDEKGLQRVNSFLNRVPFLDDLQHWGQDDYWATPAETVASHGGDCEDFSIAKYFLLKELGVPIQRLRITYVKALRLQQAHMVLAYYERPDGEPLILDNLEDRVRPASQRTDLVPVYSFNDDDVTLAADGRRGSSLEIRAWKELLQRLDAEARL